jgi:hypothetical protein
MVLVTDDHPLQHPSVPAQPLSVSSLEPEKGRAKTVCLQNFFEIESTFKLVADFAMRKPRQSMNISF